MKIALQLAMIPIGAIKMKLKFDRRGAYMLLSSASRLVLVLTGGIFLSFFSTKSFALQQNDSVQWLSADEIAISNYLGVTNNSVGAAGSLDARGLGEKKISDAALSSSVSNQADAYIEVTVNGEARPNMIPIRQLPDNSFVVQADVLREIGILPQRAATNRGGWVKLSALKNVKYSYDPKTESIAFVITDINALAPYTVSLDPLASAAMKGGAEGAIKPQSDLAAVLNYDIYADSGHNNFKDLWAFQGASATVDGRISGKFGTFYTSELLRYSSQSSNSNKFDGARLDSYWTYSDEKRMLAYQVGDVVTRSLSWSRSTRLGGFQLRRNFDLRDNLVTMALPELSGSAAVPSSVDLYINNAKRATEDVPTGPFSLTNLPVITGANTARLVVRDAMGQESVKEVSFYASSDLLAKGLWDFSFEAGVPRNQYGTNSDQYSSDLFVSASSRYGLTNRLTSEAHLEAGGNFFNGGTGVKFTLGDIGVFSLAGSASIYKGETGQQLYANAQLQRWGFNFSAMTQRNFGNYNDIASIADSKYLAGNLNANLNTYTAGIASSTSRQAKTTNQLSLSTNLRFDPTTITASYTEIKYWNQPDAQYMSISANRNFGRRVYGYATGFINFKDSKAYSIFAGVSISLDKGYSASTNVTTDRQGSRVTSRVGKSLGGQIGDYGLALRDIEGTNTQRGVDVQYRSPVALVGASIDQYKDNWRATASASGGLVLADGTVMPTLRVSDSFAVVNVGVPDVGVKVNNLKYGKTWRNGRVIIPDLISYTPSNIALDMDSLPPDVIVDKTDETVRPAVKSGVVVHFGGAAGDKYLYISLKGLDGNAVEVGSYAQVAGSDIGYDIAYDGLIIVQLNQVRLPATLDVLEKNGNTCQAVIETSVKTGLQSGSQTIVCNPMSTVK